MPEKFGVSRPHETPDSRQPVTTIGAYYKAKGTSHAAGPRPAAGSSLIGGSRRTDTQVIKPATRMFVDATTRPDGFGSPHRKHW